MQATTNREIAFGVTNPKTKGRSQFRKVPAGTVVVVRRARWAEYALNAVAYEVRVWGTELTQIVGRNDFTLAVDDAAIVSWSE